MKIVTPQPTSSSYDKDAWLFGTTVRPSPAYAPVPHYRHLPTALLLPDVGMEQGATARLAMRVRNDTEDFSLILGTPTKTVAPSLSTTDLPTLLVMMNRSTMTTNYHHAAALQGYNGTAHSDPYAVAMHRWHALHEEENVKDIGRLLDDDDDDDDNDKHGKPKAKRQKKQPHLKQRRSNLPSPLKKR